MAKIQSFKRIIEEDFPKEYKGLISKLAYSLNTFADDVSNALNRNLSISDNLNLNIKDVNVTVNNAGAPTTTLIIKTGLPGNCSGVAVVKASNQDNLVDSTKTISGITAATPPVVTATAHGFSNGDEIIISGSDSTPNVNGKWLVSGVLTANTFYLPTKTTGAGTVGSILKSNSALATPIVSFTNNSGTIIVSKITNLQPNDKYILKMVFF